MNLPNTKLQSFKKYMLLSLLSVGVLFPSTAQEEAFRQMAEEPSGSMHQGIILNLTEGEIDLTKGHWNSNLTEGTNCIKFRGDGSDSWNISKCFQLGTFKKESESIALLSREAGTLILTGDLDFEKGLGRYSFTASEELQKYLAKKEISDAEDEYLLPLFLGDMEISFIDFLIEHYGVIEAEELTQLALHEVSLEDFKEYLSLYRNYGNGDPTLEEVVATKTNGIDLQYVSELQSAGYPDLDLQEMMAAKAHGISLATIEGFAEAGFENIPMEKLLETKVQGLTTSSAVKLQQISDVELSLEAALQLQMQGVNEAYIKELEEVGLTGLNLQQLIKARMHELEPVLVNSIRNAGLNNLDFKELLAAKIQGVDTAYVATFRDARLQANDLQELVRAKNQEIDFSSMDDWREIGFEDLKLSDLLEMKVHGVKVDQIKEFREEGIQVFSIKELISARMYGVDMEYIRQHNNNLKGENQEEAGDQEKTGDQEEPNYKFSKLHEYIALKLEQDAESLQELQQQKRDAELDSVETLEKEMFEITLPETEGQ